MSDFEAVFQAATRVEPTERQVEMRRVGQALRRITHKLVGTEAPAAELADLAVQLETLAAVLEPWPQGHAYEGFAESAPAGNPNGHFDNSPIMGRSNPLAPPLVVSVEGGRVVGHVNFGAAYEGAPGCAHGGWVSAIFDELLGMTQALAGTRGMTGTLTVRYRSPTPLHRDLRLEGELVRREGRKIFTAGRCFAGDRLTAEAEALFITVDFARIVELLRQPRRNARLIREGGSAAK